MRVTTSQLRNTSNLEIINLAKYSTTPVNRPLFSPVNTCIMSAQSTTAKLGPATDSKDTTKPNQPQKPTAQLEEDDEFEDFPVEGKQSANA